MKYYLKSVTIKKPFNQHFSSFFSVYVFFIHPVLYTLYNKTELSYDADFCGWTDSYRSSKLIQSLQLV